MSESKRDKAIKISIGGDDYILVKRAAKLKGGMPLGTYARSATVEAARRELREFTQERKANELAGIQLPLPRGALL